MSLRFYHVYNHMYGLPLVGKVLFPEMTIK